MPAAPRARRAARSEKLPAAITPTPASRASALDLLEVRLREPARPDDDRGASGERPRGRSPSPRRRRCSRRRRRPRLAQSASQTEPKTGAPCLDARARGERETPETSSRSSASRSPGDRAAGPARDAGDADADHPRSPPTATAYRATSARPRTWPPETCDPEYSCGGPKGTAGGAGRHRGSSRERIWPERTVFRPQFTDSRDTSGVRPRACPA